jgi:hypothetical protein
VTAVLNIFEIILSMISLPTYAFQYASRQQDGLNNHNCQGVSACLLISYRYPGNALCFQLNHIEYVGWCGRWFRDAFCFGTPAFKRSHESLEND